MLAGYLSGMIGREVSGRVLDYKAALTVHLPDGWTPA